MADNTGLRYSKLSDGGLADFTQMIQRFGVVTVMNARVYNTAEFEQDGRTFDTYYAEGSDGKSGNAADIAEWFLTQGTQICYLDTLTQANVNVEGPTKTISGGQYTNPLIKFGKTATLEIQDALGNAKAIEALCGGLVESAGDPATTPYDKLNNPIGAFNYGGDFEGEKTIIGESFFIDQKTGKQVPVTIIFYRFLPNSVFNLTQASDGDATVFDMNGDLLNTEIMVSTTTPNKPIKHGLFYSVLPRITGDAQSDYVVEGNTITVNIPEDKTVASAYANGVPETGTNTISVDVDYQTDITKVVAEVTTNGGTAENASVDLVIFYTDGTMKTIQNIAVVATTE